MQIEISLPEHLLQLIRNYFQVGGKGCLLSSNGHISAKVHWIAGLYPQESVRERYGSAFQEMEKLLESKNGYYFGYFGYDLKNELEDLYPTHPNEADRWDLSFFRAGLTAICDESGCRIITEDPDLYEQLQMLEGKRPSIEKGSMGSLVPQMSTSEYLGKVDQVREHIAAGDVYELNLCQQFTAEANEINPYLLYECLCEVSPNPFSAYYYLESQAILCSSMERFLQKQGQILSSEPIKGTRRRNTENEVLDSQLKAELESDEKERAENIMIVDLVRNDLSRVCETGSVSVPELCRVYSFAQVHQMISRVTGMLKTEHSALDAIRAAFPAGSMTGAPKVKAMELIDRYEISERGIYSGCLGYFSPDQDFDLNVIIRTIIYDPAAGNLSVHVGGAITYDSIPEQEYEECLVKLSGIQNALELYRGKFISASRIS